MWGAPAGTDGIHENKSLAENMEQVSLNKQRGLGQREARLQRNPGSET